jgi:small-conductance mechanosensitive channel
MNTTLTGKELLDTVATRLAELLSSLVVQILGSHARAPLLGRFSAADLGAMLVIVLLVWLVHRLVARFLRRQGQTADAEPDSPGWRTQLWRMAGRPLQLLIWIYGVYFAAAPMLAKLSAREEPSLARSLLDRSFDLGLFAVLLWLFFQLTHVLEARLQAWAGKTESKWDDLVVPLLGRSLRVIVPLLGLFFALPLIGLAPESAGVLSKGGSMLLIGAVAYLLFHAVSLGERAVLAHYDIQAADNLQARKVYTQVHVLSRTLYVVTAIFAASSVLMLFEDVRRLGTSILASAGVVGIILGFAAQRTIANLFAGFQLAITQPIRLDDVVIVEGEWGRIEEITLTYVVVRIWDERRLVVPLSFFIERPFQNWTRTSADILGSVFLWTDFTVPLVELRPAVERIVAGCQDWDRRFWNLQVTDSSERGLQLRILATAGDASKAWNLRCEIREKVVAFLQEKHPASLPRIRASLNQAAPVAPG